jgi:signal transduction histidine kinase
MSSSHSKKSFNLLKWFAILSFISIAATSILAGIVLSRFLSEQLLAREATVSMEFIQSIYDQRARNALSAGRGDAQDDVKLKLFFESITRIPDVIKANIFNMDQSIAWSSDNDLLGKRFEDNADLMEALIGTLVFEHKRLDRESVAGGSTKAEHEYLPETVNEFVESYIPIRDKRNNEIVAVVELYKAPRALFDVLEKGRWLVFLVSVISGLVLYSVLFWIVRRGNLLIIQQNEALVQSERLASIGSLTRSIAHSIRNPIASIRSSAELSLEEANVTVAESMHDIINESDRLDRWIRELLVLSHTQDLVISSTSIGEIVAQAAGDLAAQLNEKNISLHVDIPEGLRNVVAEPAMLKQVVITLLANSIQASGNNGRLTIASRDSGEKLDITIQDNGVGMSKAFLADAFSPLVSGKLSGLGLGLTLAKQAIEQFGGSLSLDSALNAGTTATITLKPAT